MKRLTFVLLVSLYLAMCSHAHASLEQSIAKKYDVQTGSRKVDLLKQKRQIEDEIRSGRLADMATVAMDAAVNRAADELEKRGYYQDAIDARMKWNNFYYRIAYEIRDNPDRDVGDHPGVKFLLDLHAKISGIVGEDICHALRLHDLWNFGMTIGVVFRCQDNVPAGEYFEHFSLFTGCVAYWVSNVACMCFSPIPFVCGLAAMGVERLVVLFVVPKIQNKCFELSCNKL